MKIKIFDKILRWVWGGGVENKKSKENTMFTIQSYFCAKNE